MVVMVTLRCFSSSWRMSTNSFEIKSESDPPSRSASTVVVFPFFGFFTRTGAMERMTLSEASTLLPVDAAASQESLAGFSATSVGGVEGFGACGVWVAAVGAAAILACRGGFVRGFGVCPWRDVMWLELHLSHFGMIWQSLVACLLLRQRKQRRFSLIFSTRASGVKRANIWHSVAGWGPVQKSQVEVSVGSVRCSFVGFVSTVAILAVVDVFPIWLRV